MRKTCNAPFYAEISLLIILHIIIPLQIMILYFCNPDRTEIFAQGKKSKSFFAFMRYLRVYMFNQWNLQAKNPERRLLWQNKDTPILSFNPWACLGKEAVSRCVVCPFSRLLSSNHIARREIDGILNSSRGNEIYSYFRALCITVLATPSVR